MNNTQMRNIISLIEKYCIVWIMRNIGMDKDELLRLKQISGLQELFKDQEFSNSWEAANEFVQ